MESSAVTLRAVIFKSGNLWFGQCLEHDIAAQAKTPQELPYQLERAIVGHMVIAVDNGLAAFKNVPPAPDRYWKMFARGLDLKPLKDQKFRVQGLSATPPQPELRLSDPESTLQPT
jgi:hypothetical protein